MPANANANANSGDVSSSSKNKHRIKIRINMPKKFQTKQKDEASTITNTTTPQRSEVVIAAAASSTATATATASTATAAEDWTSSDSLPAISLSNKSNSLRSSSSSSYPINEECTAITMSPSGRLMVAGFADGTVRLFDLTGKYYTCTNNNTTGSTSATGTCSSSSGLQGQRQITGSCSMSASLHSSSVSSSSLENENEFDVSFATSTTGTSTITNAATTATTKPRKKRHFVLSKDHVTYGAVACQIHAKGVHTALRMDVAVSEDCQWAFGGVLRGSMELLAVHLGRLEASYENYDADDTTGDPDDTGDPDTTTTSKEATPSTAVFHPHHHQKHNSNNKTNLLDLVHVYRNTDAKLRGFGACTRLHNSNTYLLFTGKAIKNIHIWSFQPPPSLLANTTTSANAKYELQHQQPVWQCLYDCPTNGNTIKWLHFRRSMADNTLQAISKSEGQKLRVWDLSSEDAAPHGETGVAVGGDNAARVNKKQQTAAVQQQQRPVRPPFQDVANTESALGVAGSLSICGGSGLFNQMSIVSLDNHLQSSEYNHTELALPGTPNNGTEQHQPPRGAATSSRRQQRGEMKCVAAVTGVEGHVLLELSDGSVAEYRPQGQLSPVITLLQQQQLDHKIRGTSGIEKLQEGHLRQLAVHRVGKQGVAVASVATYNPVTGRGRIRVLPLSEDYCSNRNTLHDEPPLAGFWGLLPAAAAQTTATPPRPTTIGPSRSSVSAAIAAAADPKSDRIGCSSIQGNCTSFEHTATEPCVNLATTTPKHTVMTFKKQHTPAATSDYMQHPQQKTIAGTGVVTTIKKPAHQADFKQSQQQNTTAGGVHIVTTTKKRVATATFEQPTAHPSQPHTASSVPLARRLSATIPPANTPARVSLGDGSAAKNRDNDTSSRISEATAIDSNKASLGRAKDTEGATKEHAWTLPQEGRPSEKVTYCQNSYIRDAAIVLAMKFAKANDGTKRPATAAASLPASKQADPLKRKDLVKTKKLAGATVLAQRTYADSQTVRSGKFSEPSPAIPRKRAVLKPSVDSSDNPKIVDATTNTHLLERSFSPVPTLASTGHVLDNSAFAAALVDTPSPQAFRPTTQLKLPMPNTRRDPAVTLELILASCNVKLNDIQAIEDSFPRKSVWERKAEQESSTNHPDRLETGRRQLAAQHRVAHEIMRKRVLEAARSTVRSIYETPTLSSLEKAKGFLYCALQAYKHQTDIMLQRQMMEACTLQAMQTREVHGEETPCVQVVFSFPLIFDQAMGCLPDIK